MVQRFGKFGGRNPDRLLVLSVPGMLILVFGGYAVLRLMNRRSGK